MSSHSESQSKRMSLRWWLGISILSTSAPLVAQEKGVEPGNPTGVEINLSPNATGPSALAPTAPQSNELVSQPVQGPERTVPSQERPTTPIQLPSLSVPDISLDHIGNGKIPEDWVEGRLPATIPLPFGPDRQLAMSYSLKTWTAPVFCHQPLYFEDTMLERHGQERFPHLTPLISGVRFYTGILTTPYMVHLHRPLEDVCNTGHYRPGSAAPGLRERAPYDAGALRFQLLTTGAVFVGAQP